MTVRQDQPRWTVEEWVDACRRLNPHYATKIGDDGHTPIKHDTCDRAACMFCDGGLFACEVCGGLEGAVPTHCPGRGLTTAETDAVYTGDLDYRDGQWVNAPSIHSPALSARVRLVLA